MTAFIFSLFLWMIPIENLENQLIITDDERTLETVKLNQYEMSYVDTIFLNEGKLDQLMRQLNEKIYKKPVNATLRENGEIVQEKSGISLNRLKFKQLFFKSFYLGKPTKIEIPKQEVFPKVDSELLAEIKENEIGHYVTHFKVSNKERSHNIELAADAINNHVVFPGETFSFNKVVGKRTEEKGYKRAPVIVKGELAEDIGGGICQVSSTLYNAVNLKGIQIVERYSHSRSVPYVPPGRDATVSWWGPDFVFKNTYNQPILIRATSKNGTMKVDVYSSNSVELHKKD